LESAIEAAAVAPAVHFDSLCELVALLYGSEDASLGISSSSRSAALLLVAESLASLHGGQHLAINLAQKLCAEGYQPVWKLASQLGCYGASAAGVSDPVPVAVAESIGGWDDARQELTAFALASCDEAALPQMLAAAEVHALQHSTSLYKDTVRLTAVNGKEGMQVWFM
jgi:hypothetical protein